MKLATAKILVVSKNETDEEYLREFFSHLEIPEPTFVIGKLAPADKFDFIVFNAKSSPPIRDIKVLTELPDEFAHFQLLEGYLARTSKNILFYGSHYYNLNYDRCPSANSKFTLFARLRELVDFMNSYR